MIQLKLRKEMRYTPVDELFVSLEQLRSDLDEAVKNNVRVLESVAVQESERG